MKILFPVLSLFLLILCGCPKQADQSADGSGSSADMKTASQDEAVGDHSGSGHDADGDEHASTDSAGHDEDAGRHDMSGEDAETANPCEAAAEAAGARETLSNMSKFLVTGDRDAFIACFHPESPELEEMTSMFDEIQDTIVAVQVVNAELTEAGEEFAMLEYELSISESGKEQRTESGMMEMMRNADGAWVIFDMN